MIYALAEERYDERDTPPSFRLDVQLHDLLTKSPAPRPILLPDRANESFPEPVFPQLVQKQYKYGYAVFFKINICRNNLENVKQLTEIARENGIATDYHINESPMIEQSHFKHYRGERIPSFIPMTGRGLMNWWTGSLKRTKRGTKWLIP